MDSQKRENLLNLSLDATEEERQRSMELNVGVEEDGESWEIIVRYSGDLSRYEQELGFERVELLGGYAILNVKREQLEAVSRIPEIAYIEKPKRLFFELDLGRRASCITPLQSTVTAGDSSQRLFGRGCVIAILDSGVDYFHEDFRDEDGRSRILRIWDQTLENFPGQPPEGYRMGVEFRREQIEEALAAGSREAGLRIVPVTDESGHGTAVAGIAAGNGRASKGRYRGVAPESELLIVKLGKARESGFPRTTELMQAVDYAVKFAAQRNLPLAVNISIGNTYGSHDGTALLESYLNTAADVGRTVIVTGTGNEGIARGHTSKVIASREEQIIEFSVGAYESKLNIQLWKYYVDDMSLELVMPSGERIGPFEQKLGTQRFTAAQTEFLIFYGEPAPYTKAQEIYIDMIPTENASFINSGFYEIHVRAQRIVQGEYHLWMPSYSVLGGNTGFLFPTPDITLTIPATAAKLISVGAYDAASDSFSDFSGRGYTRVVPMVKPELVAPGVRVMAPAPTGGYQMRTGTSFAAPFVTGAAALLMEFGIVQDNDPYLYGEKVKAYLIRGARQLPGFDRFPNPLVGWGALCVSESLLRR